MSLIVLYLCYNTKSCSLTMLAAWMPLAAALQINIVNLWPSLWSTLRRICIPPEFEMLDVEFAPVQHGIRPLKKISAPGHNAELLYLSIHSFVFFTLSSASFFGSRLGSLSGLQHEVSNIQTKKHYSRAESILDENSGSCYCSIKLKRLLEFIRRVKSWKNERHGIYGSVCQDWLWGRLSRTQMQDSGTRELN